jgi:hypothetical protein
VDVDPALRLRKDNAMFKDKKGTPALDRLAELRAAAVAARTRVREIEGQQAAAKAAADEARERLVKAYSVADELRATELVKVENAAVRAAAEPWDARLAGAKRAVQRAEAEREGFISASYEHLVRERTPSAVAAAEGLEWALQGACRRPGTARRCPGCGEGLGRRGGGAARAAQRRAPGHRCDTAA